MKAAATRLLVVEPEFVPRRTIALSAGKLGLALVDEAGSLGMALQKLRAQPYDTVVLALDAGPPAEVQRLLQACAPARVIGVAPPGQPAATPQLRAAGLAHVLDKPARVKLLLALLGAAPATSASPVAQAAASVG